MPCENKHSFLQLSPSPKICQNSVVQNPSSCCQSITSVRVGLGSGLTADERDARPYRFTLFLILSILLILSKTTTTPAYQSINPTIKQFLHALHGYCHLSFRRERRARPTLRTEMERRPYQFYTAVIIALCGVRGAPALPCGRRWNAVPTGSTRLLSLIAARSVIALLLVGVMSWSWRVVCFLLLRNKTIPFSNSNSSLQLIIDTMGPHGKPFTRLERRRRAMSNPPHRQSSVFLSERSPRQD